VFTYNLRFPGQQYDSVTGFNYNYFRDYDPAVARYVQSDPIGLKGGVNSYLYVVANPLALIDPRGLKPGDKFPTVEDALKDLIRFAPTLNPKWAEHGGWIYPVGECFTYNATTSRQPSIIYNKDMMRIRPPLPAASWHTHGFRGPSDPRLDENKLSGSPGGNSGDTGFAEYSEVPNYLIKPAGGASGYDPKTNAPTPDVNGGDPCKCKQ
jgi:RHS repeat-associated protein